MNLVVQPMKKQHLMLTRARNRYVGKIWQSLQQHPKTNKLSRNKQTHQTISLQMQELIQAKHRHHGFQMVSCKNCQTVRKQRGGQYKITFALRFCQCLIQMEYLWVIIGQGCQAKILIESLQQVKNNFFHKYTRLESQFHNAKNQEESSCFQTCMAIQYQKIALYTGHLRRYLPAIHAVRNLPFILWHNTKYFKLNSCKFKFNKDMAQTARLYFQIKQSILTYTCQISLGLYYSGMHTFQMMEEDYRTFGGSIITSIVEMIRKQKITASQGFEYEITSQNRTIQNVDKSKQEDKTKLNAKEISKIKQKQTKVQSVSVSKRQNKRETCIQKIKNIKKELVEEQGKKQKEKQEKQKQKNNVRQKEKAKISREKQEKKFESRDLNLGNKVKGNLSQQIKNNFKYSLGATFYNSNFKDYNYKPNISNFYFNTPASTHVIESSLRNTQEDEGLIRAGRVSKTNKQTQFKIRRKPDIFKVIPESIRKKLGIKLQANLSNTKHLIEQPQFRFERAATFDSSYLSNQILTVEQTIKQREQSEDMLREEMELQIIDEKFSDEYQSMNDSDNSSEDLTYKEKQYIIECLKNNKKMKTNNEEQQQQGVFNQNYNQEQRYEEAIYHYPTTININGFKQIRFKSIEGTSNASNGNKLQMRTTKRQIYKFRDYTHKSLGKNLYEQESSMMPQMIQKKQLNERIASNKKSVREPYYLVQINKKYHQSNNLSITK